MSNKNLWGIWKLIWALPLVSLSSISHAQQYEHGGQLQTCVETFFDQSMYGWLALRNTCTMSISVTHMGRDGTHSGSVDIRAGGHVSTGYSRTEWEQAGGIVFAVCNGGYRTIEANRQFWSHPNADFLCAK
jgi:hypothetical protein